MSCKFWRRSSAARRREKEKLGVFVGLFVTLWTLNLNNLLAHQMFNHSNSNVVAIYWSILMRISAFFRGRNALSNV